MRYIMGLIAAAGAFLVAPATAKTYTIAMRNSAGGRTMVFEPAFVQAKPGDTIIFKAVDKGHDAVSIPSVLPAGATPIAGRINQDVTVKLSTPGLYGIKCTPHFSMGMVALIKVGDGKANMNDARSAVATLPYLPKKALTSLLTQANIR